MRDTIACQSVAGYAFERSKLFAARSMQESSVTAHMCLERILNHFPRRDVLSLGELADTANHLMRERSRIVKRYS